MNLRICPDGNDRFVAIEHGAWNSRWRMQFPEIIKADEGTIMAWPLNCHPQWEKLSDGWGYSWRTTEVYGADVRAMNHRDTSGNPEYGECFFVGLALRAEMRARDDGLQLCLTLTNESSRVVHSVLCDGGCWQARCDAFIDSDEVARSHVMIGRKMVSMSVLPRTVDVRCMYRCDPSTYDGQSEWFWGRSRTAIDSPAIVGAVSTDDSKAVVLGYAVAQSGMANSDNHHCLHSNPLFGDIAPGQSVRRTGYVLFGSDIHALGNTLRTKLEAVSQNTASNKTDARDG